MLALVWTSPAGGVARPYARADIGVWFAVIGSSGLLLGGAAVLVSSLFGPQPLYRKQGAVLLLSALAPLTADGMDMLEFSPAAPHQDSDGHLRYTHEHLRGVRIPRHER
jgi:N-terminal 7TM region of histidine kinase